jgi:hypothetical protein
MCFWLMFSAGKKQADEKQPGHAMKILQDKQPNGMTTKKQKEEIWQSFANYAK